MRLWGAHGQKLLETAHICVLGSGPTASETLKNLVLPNIGEFTIIDDAVVGESDLGNNFFVDEDSLGKPRAEVVKTWLLEMNPEVRGNHIVKKTSELLNDLSFFDKFELVILCGQSEEVNRKICAHRYEHLQASMVLQSYGLLGRMRTVLREHLVIESHPDNDRYDLYIHPAQWPAFPQLQQYCEEFDLDSKEMSDEAHAHVPYLVVLVQHMKKWMKEHNGQPPLNYEQNKQFKELIRQASRNINEEENFQEAVDYAHRAYQKPQVDHLVAQVFSDAKAAVLTKASRAFWLIAHAVNQFVQHEGHGFLPVSPALPDMHSTTANYIKLKEIFKAKFDEDVGVVERYVQQQLQALQLPLDSIARSEIEHFVRHVRQVRCVRTSALDSEYEPQDADAAEELNEIFNEEEYEEGDESDPSFVKVPNPKSPHWYMALRCAEAFHTKHGRYPGTPLKCDVESDAAELLTIGEELYPRLHLQASPDADVAAEITRHGATEIHNTAAFMGGVAAQEALKIIMKQYIPLNSTLVFNGIHGACYTFKI